MAHKLQRVEMGSRPRVFNVSRRIINTAAGLSWAESFNFSRKRIQGLVFFFCNDFHFFGSVSSRTWILRELLSLFSFNHGVKRSDTICFTLRLKVYLPFADLFFVFLGIVGTRSYFGWEFGNLKLDFSFFSLQCDRHFLISN